MKRATITQAKNGLSALIDQVKSGESILITDRGVPVARLEPPPSSAPDDDGRIDRLVRAGLATRGTGETGWLLDRPLTPTSGSVVELLLQDRDSGR